MDRSINQSTYQSINWSIDQSLVSARHISSRATSQYKANKQNMIKSRNKLELKCKLQKLQHSRSISETSKQTTQNALINSKMCAVKQLFLSLCFSSFTFL